MSGRHGYPERVEDVLDLTIRFKPEVIQCVRRFARSKPWRGTAAERREKFCRFHVQLAAALSTKPPRLIVAGSASSDSGRSCYIPSLDTIILHGLSVVTFLHEWGHKVHGQSERERTQFRPSPISC